MFYTLAFTHQGEIISFYIKILTLERNPQVNQDNKMWQMLVGITFYERITWVGCVLELILVSCMKMFHENVLGLWHVWQPILKRVSHTSSYSATVSASFWHKVGNIEIMWFGLLVEKRPWARRRQHYRKVRKDMRQMRVKMEPQRTGLAIGYSVQERMRLIQSIF